MNTVALRRIASVVTECPDLGRRPFVALENVEAGSGRLADGDLEKRDCPASGAAAVEPGCVLFGKLRPYLAKTWVADRPVYASTELLALRPRNDIESRWLAYVCSSRPVVVWSVATSDGTKMPRTSWEKLGAFRLDVPPRNTQRKIAEYLDAETARIDALIAKKRRMSVLLDERSFALLSKVLVPRDSGFARLGRFASIQTGLTVDSSRPLDDDVVTRPYLRVANVLDGRLALDTVTEIRVPRSLAERATLRFGDVLMTEGGDLDKLGRGTVWRDQIPGCLHQNHIFAVRPDSARLDPDYLALLTQAAHGRAYFERTGSRSTNLASTTAAKVLDLPVPVLPVERQRALVGEATAALRAASEITARLTRQIALLRERRQALITEAVTGQLESCVTP